MPALKAATLASEIYRNEAPLNSTPYERKQPKVKRGEDNGVPLGSRLRLTDAEVREIREAALTTTQVEIAKAFGVSKTTIAQIVRRKIRRETNEQT